MKVQHKVVVLYGATPPIGQFNSQLMREGLAYEYSLRKVTFLQLA